MKKFDLTRILFLITSLVIIISGFIIPESNLPTSICSGLLILVLVVFDIQAPKIAKLSEDNPKVKTMRTLNRLSIFILIICSIFMVLSPIKTPFSSKTNELILVGLASLFIMFFGNLSPKIPFNRYLGLRLPWTIRDENTWKIAHKIVGYLSFPIAIVMFVSSFFFKVEVVATVCVLTWIIIPSMYSLLFYYKKIKGINI